MERRRSRGQWAALVASFGEASQSVASFCASKRIAPGTFRWWRWRLGQSGREPVSMIPVTVKGEMGRASITIAVSDVEVRVEVGTDLSYVTALVRSLRASC